VTTSKILLTALFVVATAGTGVAHAQSKAGYWTQGGSAVWKNGSGQCWRAGHWTPAMAIAECDPDLVKRPAPKPAARPAPAPKPKPMAKPKPKVLVITLMNDETFDFNKAVLKPAARAHIDRDVLGKISTLKGVKVINVQGHTDRIGSSQYNQKLSERRAEAVKAYLVSKGVSADKVETFGFGKTLPVKNCPDVKNAKALHQCLAPNRRAVIEVLEQL